MYTFQLTENHDPCPSVKPVAEALLDLCTRSSKADDEYPIQYPNDNGPRAAMKVARIALPTLTFCTISLDWMDEVNSFSSSVMLDALFDANHSIYGETGEEVTFIYFRIAM